MKINKPISQQVYLLFSLVVISIFLGYLFNTTDKSSISTYNNLYDFTSIRPYLLVIKGSSNNFVTQISSFDPLSKEITYTLVLTNPASSATAEVVITDILPLNAVFVRGEGWNAPEDGIVTQTFFLEGTATRVLTIAVSIDSLFDGSSITNTALAGLTFSDGSFLYSTDVGSIFSQKFLPMLSNPSLLSTPTPTITPTPTATPGLPCHSWGNDCFEQNATSPTDQRNVTTPQGQINTNSVYYGTVWVSGQGQPLYPDRRDYYTISLQADTYYTMTLGGAENNASAPFPPDGNSDLSLSLLTMQGNYAADKDTGASIFSDNLNNQAEAKSFRLSVSGIYQVRVLIYNATLSRVSYRLEIRDSP